VVGSGHSMYNVVQVGGWWVKYLDDQSVFNIEAIYLIFRSSFKYLSVEYEGKR